MMDNFLPTKMLGILVIGLQSQVYVIMLKSDSCSDASSALSMKMIILI